MRRSSLIATASLLLTLSTGAAAHAQERRAPQRLVEELQVEGNRRLSDEQIIGHIETRAGDPYNPAQVRRDLQTLLGLPHFDKSGTRVSIDENAPRGGVIVSFTVMELPVIRDIAFEGLRSVSAEELTKALGAAEIGLTKESAYDPVRVKRAERAIKELLTRRGRPRATVRAEVEEVSAQTVGLVFRIDEGRRGRRAEPEEREPWRIGPIPLWREPGRLRRHPKRV